MNVLGHGHECDDCSDAFSEDDLHDHEVTKPYYCDPATGISMTGIAFATYDRVPQSV